MKTLPTLFSGLVVLLCTFIFTTHFYPGTMENEPAGFRGVLWHTTISDDALGFGGQWDRVYTVMGERASHKVYERKNERLFIGASQIESIFYVFQEDAGFVGAVIFFEGEENFRHLCQTCAEEWGKPVSVKQKDCEPDELDFTALFWSGNKVEATMWYVCENSFGSLEIYLKTSRVSMKEESGQIPQNEHFGGVGQR